MKAKQPKQRSKAMQSSNDRYWKFRPMLDAMHVIADGRIDELTRKQVNAFEDCMMNHILEMLDNWPESDNGWSCRPISDTFLNRLDAAFKEERAQKN